MKIRTQINLVTLKQHKKQQMPEEMEILDVQEKALEKGNYKYLY